MIQTTTRILSITPYEEMHRMMEQAAQTYPDVQIDVYTGDLEEGVAVIKQMPADFYDCIISRGGTATLLRQVGELPVIEIPVSVYDVLSTINLAETYSKSYTIVGFPTITETAHTLCDLLGYERNIVTVHNTEEATATLEQLKADGCRMIICDVVTHTIAKGMNFDAFLIASGIDSLHAAIHQALDISQWFGKLRQENKYLKSITQDQNGRIIVLKTDGTKQYCSTPQLPAELLVSLQAHINEIPERSSLKFYYTEKNLLFQITAQTLLSNNVPFYLFYCIPSKISLQSGWGKGIRALNRGQCEHLLADSFYSLPGALGNFEPTLSTLATSRTPIMIQGEPGTEKEIIAKLLYLKSSLVNKPFIQVDCELLSEKSWDFLLNHDNSPLNSVGSTIYFKNCEVISESQLRELIAVIIETGLYSRIRLLFSSADTSEPNLVDKVTYLIGQLSCQLMTIPALRTRTDEISFLASICLNSLKTELGKQLYGFEPRAIEMLSSYEWPNNYRQFQRVITTLANLTTSTYIKSDSVAELLLIEQQSYSIKFETEKIAPRLNASLADIIYEVVNRTVDENNGNQSAAARQLKISRTTLWRYLNRD